MTCSSIVTPKYLVLHFGSIFCALDLKFTFLWTCFVGYVKTNISVLLAVKDILFALSQ